MIEELGIPVSQTWTTQEQILPLSLETFEINPNLLNAPKICEIWQFNTKIKGISEPERTRIRQPRGKFKIHIIPEQFSSRHTVRVQNGLVLLMILCFAPRQLRFSPYSGAESQKA